MNHQGARRRLEKLEAQARRQAISADAARMAASSGIDVDELMAEAERIARLRVDLGHDEMLVTVAAEIGLSVEELLAGIASFEDTP